MKSTIAFAAAALTIAACTASAGNPGYRVTVNNPGVDDGAMLYLMNYDTSEKIDSTVVAGSKASFAGDIGSPAFVRLVSDGNRLGMFILESGDITVDGDNAAGTPLNAALNAFGEQVQQLNNSFRNVAPEDTAAQRAIYDRYLALNDSMMNANIANPIGYYLFLQKAYEMDRDELNADLAKHPALKDYTRIQKVINVFDRQDATAAGKMFTDFEIAGADGSVQRLSDYVGKGKYVLVDFWASWCGPCRRKMPHLKELYSAYSPKGLEVLGVAVWDEPDNTLAAIEQMQLPWKQIINAQTIPTDLYGILGIPCIILFAPDGTIVGRNFEDDELNAILAQAYTK